MMLILIKCGVLIIILNLNIYVKCCINRLNYLYQVRLLNIFILYVYYETLIQVIDLLSNTNDNIFLNIESPSVSNIDQNIVV